ncbi:hypothetical protein LJC12_00625 [Odoribacter sp. OttesenSCG-928-J03]|nr:hypothetical protein [Odoribacter sp. OttesenSCG-928-J03]MDL2331248.1 hypothetical protein [Odoribacter sp. OttesenSCG-928-A06]
MEEKKLKLTEKLRTYISRYGINEFSEENLKKVGLSLNELKENFADRKDIVYTLLYHERRCFEEIFEEYNFDGWNAIDILLLVSNEINGRFFNVTPSVTMVLADAFPDIYTEHKNNRSEYIYDKMIINIEKGKEQGMYTKEISSEMIVRMFIAKLNDIHNPEIYPPEAFTFATIFNSLIDNLIDLVANEDGKSYYRHRKQLYSVLNFR